MKKCFTTKRFFLARKVYDQSVCNLETVENSQKCLFRRGSQGNKWKRAAVSRIGYRVKRQIKEQFWRKNAHDQHLENIQQL